MTVSIDFDNRLDCITSIRNATMLKSCISALVKKFEACSRAIEDDRELEHYLDYVVAKLDDLYSAL